MTQTKSIQKQSDIKSLLTNDKVRAQIQAALPKHMTADRMARVALTALLKTPKLAQCNPESFMKAMMDCSSMGIEPDGRRAHLIPYGDQVQLIIDYKGLVELVRRSGDVKSIMAQVVYENDEFEYTLGLAPDIHHKPAMGDRGNPIAAYAVAQLNDGAVQFEVMSVQEIEDVRKRSKAAKSGPWVTDWAEMAKKTVFRRLTKWLPLSYEIAEAISKDDAQFESGHSHQVKNVTPAPLQLFSGSAPAYDPTSGGDDSKGNTDPTPHKSTSAEPENQSPDPVDQVNRTQGEKTAAGGKPNYHGIIRRQLTASKITEKQLIEALVEIGVVDNEKGETKIDQLDDTTAQTVLANWESVIATVPVAKEVAK